MKRRAKSDDSDTVAPKTKRGRYKLYEYRDSSHDVPRRTEYDKNNPKPKRPRQSLQPKPSTPLIQTKQKLVSKQTGSNLGLLCQTPIASPNVDESSQVGQVLEEQGNTSRMSEGHGVENDCDAWRNDENDYDVGETDGNDYDVEGNDENDCDIWELVEDINIEMENFNHMIEEDFPEINDLIPDSPCTAMIQPTEPSDHDSESEDDQEDLAEATNLNLSLSEKIKLMLLLATKKRHKLTYRAAETITQLAGIFSDADVSFAPSKHIMKEAIRSYSTCVSEHHLCGKCTFYHGPASEDFQCLRCGEHINLKANTAAGNRFLYLSITEQLKFLLECGLLSKLILPQNRHKINLGNYEDIYDGKMYKDKILNENCISFNCFIDGLQIATTNKNSGYPVLLCINELPLKLRRRHIIMASIWVSKKKPNMNEYLKPFVEECKQLARVGISVNYQDNVRTLKVRPLVCVSDSVARPVLRNSTQFNGKFGCGICYHPGFSLKRGNGHARSYSIREREYPLRTHEETMNLARTAERLNEPQKGIKGISILSTIEGFDIIHCLDLDLFHALVNTAKRFGNLWFSERYKKKRFNVFNNLAELDRRLLAIQVTEDVSRAPRSLLERSDYRGHEWFYWIIFYSIPVLKGILPSRYLNHWAFLVHAIVLLMQNSVAKTEVFYAAKYLRKFNVLIDKLYGREHVTFSCHLLTHLESSVKNFAQPWSHSAFMFESFLAELKNAVKGGNGVAYQIITHMQLKIALLKMKADLSFAMTDRDKKYLESVTVFKPYADPHLILGTVAFLGKPVYSKLSTESYSAIIRSGFTCDDAGEYPVYLRCFVDDEIFHSSNYSRAVKIENSIVLLDTNDVFHIDLFIVIENNALALGHFLIEDTRKVCDVSLPHMRVFKEKNEGMLNCIPISRFQSKLLSFTVRLHDCVLRLGYINVLKMEMLI